MDSPADKPGTTAPPLVDLNSSTALPQHLNSGYYQGMALYPQQTTSTAAQALPDADIFGPDFWRSMGMDPTSTPTLTLLSRHYYACLHPFSSVPDTLVMQARFQSAAVVIRVQRHIGLTQTVNET